MMLGGKGNLLLLGEISGEESLMGKESAQKDRDRLYSVERFREFLASQNHRPPARGIWRFTRRFRRAMGSISGVASALLGIPIMFGGLFAVIIGALYGPLAFVSATVGTLGLVAFYVNRKVGKSIQFGDFPLGRRILAQVIGSMLVITLILLFYFVGLMNR